MDLDFGIYRILNIKKKEISDFIDKELFEVIEKELGKSETEEVVERQICDHMINFFLRYYDNGDFISKRRYSKTKKYVIPYNGEEVYLYWVNNDQYYVKTSEDFKNYRFMIDGLTVEFKRINDEFEVRGISITNSEKRYYIFRGLGFEKSVNTLELKFAYRGLTEKEIEAIKTTLNKNSIKKEYVNAFNIKNVLDQTKTTVFPKLAKKHLKMNGEESELSELAWHLNRYTTKNTSDYFIHKDLRGFLNQELDFYIKSEIFSITDFELEAEKSLITKIVPAFKTICQKLIIFLAQIEDFQKRLWEKRKFVISTNYCLTLDHIHEKHYPEILANEEQLREWRTLFNIDFEEIKRERGSKNITDNGGYRNIDFLKRFPTLVLDTRFFDSEFKYRILSEIRELDSSINGILIKSNNYHALNLILNKYREKVKCCYIDPPYNTGNDEFLYKDNYRHSSWLTMMYEHLMLGRELLNDEGSLFVSIDDNEMDHLRLCLDHVFGRDNFIEQLTIVSNPRGRSLRKYISSVHEYCLVCAKNIEAESIYGQEPDKKRRAHYNEIDELGQFRWLELRNRNPKFNAKNRPNLFFPIYANPVTYEVSLTEKEDWIKVEPLDSKGTEDCWTWGKEKVRNNLKFLRAKKTKNMNWIIQRKDYLHKEDGTIKLKKPFSVWDEREMNTEKGTEILRHQFGYLPFDFPKSPFFIQKIVEISTRSNNQEIILDYFAGSGTTGQAVLNQNKKDKGTRKFILVEMAQYFESILLPRIKKVIFSENWLNGEPQDKNGIPRQILKYQSLEQYEDSLLNIEFVEPRSSVKESKDYKLKYMLDYETSTNNIFLNLDFLDNPFGYKLKIEENGKTREVNADLVETFNYLAGIDVNFIYLKNDAEIRYIFIKGQQGEKSVFVVWRNKPESFNPERDKEFVEREIANDKYDEVFVNGNSLIRNAKPIDVVFKEELFR